MIRKIFNRIKSAYNFDQLVVVSTAAINNVMEGNNPSLNYLKEMIETFINTHPNFFEKWKEHHYERLKQATDASNIADQIIRVRELTLDALEVATQSKAFLDRDDTERSILAPILKMEDQDSSAEFNEAVKYIFNEANCCCFRSISYFLRDVGPNDWFDVYGNLYSIYINLGYNTIISNEKKDTFPLEVFCKPFQHSVQGYRSRVLKGEKLSLTDDELEMLEKVSSNSKTI